jgi:rhodanese-related sulfurtransferase
MLKNSFVRAVVIIAAAAALAIVTNGFASRQRRLVLPGYYPNALRVPPPETERVPPPPVTMTAPETASPTSVPATASAPETATPPPVPSAVTTGTIPATSTAAVKPAPTATAAPTTTTDPRTSPVAPAVDPLARFTPHPDKPYVEISGQDAAMLHSKGVLFLDARRTSVFEEGHIAGARTFSVWESDIDDKVMKLYEERSDPAEQNRPIVIYCSGGACEDSHMLAQKLWGVQFNNVYVYKDGFPDWQQRNGAARTGAQP